MTTDELLMIQVKALTELELDSFLQKVGEHLSKNNLEHLINNAFDMDDNVGRVEELEDENENLQEKVERLENELAEVNEELEKFKKAAL